LVYFNSGGNRLTVFLLSGYCLSETGYSAWMVDEDNPGGMDNGGMLLAAMYSLSRG